jgi:hypothetical protein
VKPAFRQGVTFKVQDARELGKNDGMMEETGYSTGTSTYSIDMTLTPLVGLN